MLDGRLIEMDTGEGKTITAGLAAATAALAGIPVHVITVNNYLAERDAETLAPVYRRLGLRVGVILDGMDRPARREAYRASVTYGSNSEMAFDYLRDRIGFGASGPNAVESRLRRIADPGAAADGPVMRGLHFAIVDEADSVLVDEARTPLIISRMSDAEEEAAWAMRALGLAQALERDIDYRLVAEERRVMLTEEGRARIGELVAEEDGLWQSAIRREEVVTQALSVLHIFKRGDQYLVRDGKVQIVDEYTGHLQPDRSWSDGLHQLVQAAEAVEITGQNLAVARMTYQRLYRRYVHLCGMTGTAREVSGELRAVYGLVTERVPPRKPSRLPRLRASASVAPRSGVSAQISLGSAFTEPSACSSAMPSAAEAYCGSEMSRISTELTIGASRSSEVGASSRNCVGGVVQAAAPRASRSGRKDSRFMGQRPRISAEGLRSMVRASEVTARAASRMSLMAASVCALKRDRSP